MVKSTGKTLAAFFFWIAFINPIFASETEEWGLKIVLGDKTPLADACYENARDGLEDHEALEPCNVSLESEPLSQRRRAGVHANRGVIYYNIGEYEASVSDFSSSLELGINVEAKIRVNRGLSFEALGYESLARADYAAALVINPSHPIASERLKELRKPLYERARQPRKITVEAQSDPMTGI